MPARKTPRTPAERAQDAARRTATLFEDLPPSPYVDDYLEPIATLLRFWFGSASERRADEAERAYRGLVGRLRESYRRELADGRQGTNAELLGELSDLLDELMWRLENYVEAAPSSPEAADEGLALAAKVERLLDDARYGSASSVAAWQRKLERIAVGHV